jgi:hypothetical protein
LARFYSGLLRVRTQLAYFDFPRPRTVYYQIVVLGMLRALILQQPELRRMQQQYQYILKVSQ